jgi:hypothetical protein
MQLPSGEAVPALSGIAFSTPATILYSALHARVVDQCPTWRNRSVTNALAVGQVSLWRVPRRVASIAFRDAIKTIITALLITLASLAIGTNRPTGGAILAHVSVSITLLTDDPPIVRGAAIALIALDRVGYVTEPRLAHAQTTLLQMANAIAQNALAVHLDVPVTLIAFRTQLGGGVPSPPRGAFTLRTLQLVRRGPVVLALVAILNGRTGQALLGTLAPLGVSTSAFASPRNRRVDGQMAIAIAQDA